MAASSTSKEGLRHRTVAGSNKKTAPTADDIDFDKLVNSNVPSNNSDLAYKLALAIITVLAFVTRFWGISHPNEVVFDEVHFGKVWAVPGPPSTLVVLYYSTIR